MPNSKKILTDSELEEIKQKRWYSLTHSCPCNICGADIEPNGESYYGCLLNGSNVHICSKCKSSLSETHEFVLVHDNDHKLPKADDKLWRYMDLAKFLSLLETKSLYFTRLDNFEDPFEGALGTRSNEKTWVKNQLELRKKLLLGQYKKDNIYISDEELTEKAKEQLNEFRRNVVHCRRNTFVSCWHQSDFESEAMWQLYTKDNKQGVAIQTTFYRLYQSLPITANALFGMVKYVDFNKCNNGSSDNNFHPFEAPWYKRLSFAHENEFRVIIKDIREPGFQDWNKEICINPLLLIEKVFVSPTADTWFVRLLQDIVWKRYRLNLPVVQSDLCSSPFF